MDNDLEMKKAARAIGGATTRAYHLTYERTNRILMETRKFESVAMAAADGFEKKYSELLELAERFTYTIKTLTENNFPTALIALQKGIAWLREHKEESVDGNFMANYMYGYSLDIYKSEIKIARKKAKMTQQEFAEIFNVSLDTVKSWDCGRRRPDRLKENLILEKIEKIKEEKGL